MGMKILRNIYIYRFDLILELILSDGRLVSIARHIERNFLPVCQLLGPIFMSLVFLWIGFWFPEVLANYKKIPDAERNILFWFKLWTTWILLLSLIISVGGGLLGIRESRLKDETIKNQEE
ncbi:hypothetical protein EII20_06645 [Comamonadaceae bacterium OH2545_COT-014]|nr:hypothetical protein EII20_06645 [Comamonadaceae bacterium OH2545_COT-014]